MPWFIERILSNKKMPDKIHTDPKFFVTMKGSFIVPTLYNMAHMYCIYTKCKTNDRIWFSLLLLGRET